MMNIDFDDIDPVEEQEELMTAPGGGLDFTPDEMLSARALSAYSVKTIICALVTRTISIKIIDMSIPEPHWPTKVYAAYCSFIGSLGSSRMTDRPLGELVNSQLAELEAYPTNVLLASLLTEKSVITRLVTDATLPVEFASIKGARVECVDGVTNMRVAGWAGVLRIASTGDAKGRVISGGEDFCRWYNVVHKTALRYEVVYPLARDLAFAASIMYVIKIEKLEIRVGDRPATAKSGLPDIIGHLATPLSSRRMKIASLIRDAWSNPGLRPSMPSKDMRSFLECLLSRYLLASAAADRDKIAAMMDGVRASLSAQWVKIKDIQAFRDLSKLGPDEVKSVVAGVPVLGKSFTSLGSVRAFVEESRAIFREDADLVRKSDAYNLGYVAASHTSVPEKITRCLSALKALTGKDEFVGVDAFGTGAKNYWAPTINRVVRDCKYYDRNIKFRPPLGEPFQERDIESLAPKCGEGRWVFDDTYNAPDSDNGSGVSKFNAAKKIKAILSANYEGGFIKLMYGAGEEALTLFRNVPATVAAITDAYTRYFLLPGGTAHSPEYYLIFARGTGDGWVPKPMTARGIELEGSTATDLKVYRDQYVRNWNCFRAVEIIRANVMLNIQLAIGMVQNLEAVCMTGVRPVTEIYLGGSAVPTIGHTVEASVEGENGDDAYSFLGFDVAPIPPPVQNDLPVVDVGMLGSGNSKGDGPVPVYVLSTPGTDRMSVRKAALRIISREHAVTPVGWYPPYNPAENEHIFGVTYDKFLEDVTPGARVGLNSPEFGGACYVTRVTDGAHPGVRFKMLAYVPPSRDTVVCMYYN